MQPANVVLLILVLENKNQMNRKNTWLVKEPQDTFALAKKQL